MDQVTALISEYADIATGYLRRPEFLFQLGAIIILFLPAWYLSTRIEPLFEKRVRQISGMPGLLRVLAAFLRRLEWLFYVILLGATYVATDVFGWPPNNYLLYSVMLLSGAWLLINVVSHAIRSRLIGKLFTVLVWVFVAASVLGKLTALDHRAGQFLDEERHALAYHDKRSDGRRQKTIGNHQRMVLRGQELRPFLK